jgi:hypothetical protein
MNEYDKMLKKLHEEYPIDDLVKFNELNVHDALQENDWLIVKYRDLYHKELDKLERIKELLEKTMGERYKYYRFDCNEEWTKPEIENYALPNDKHVRRMKKLVQKQQARVRFFQMAWKAFESRAWSMSNFLKTL